MGFADLIPSQSPASESDQPDAGQPPILECEILNDVPEQWIDGIRSLARLSAPKDIPVHRWCLFLQDCSDFLFARENGAGRAAQLGWDAEGLFGCRLCNPLAHFGVAGLLWHVAGGRLTKLYVDWALIENSANGAQRVFHRRDTYAAGITLPWRPPVIMGIDQRAV